MAESCWDVKYDEELVKEIQEIFINKTVPDNFILVIHKYNRNVLTLVDIEHLQKIITFKANKEVNYALLLKMKSYKGWFEVILQVCNDPDVRQGYLAEAFEDIKRKLDAKLTKDQTEKKEIDTGLVKVALRSVSDQGAVTMGRQLSTNGGKLDAKLTKDQTKKKEIDTGLVKVALRSVSDQGAVTMGRQLSTNGDWETDPACMPSGSIQRKDKNTQELSIEDNSGPTQQSSWEGLKLKNGKPYCDICSISLTSKKAAEEHYKGRQHMKNLKEAFPASQEWSKTDITMAIMSQATYNDDDNAKPPLFEPNPVSIEAAVSSGPVSDYKGTPGSLKPMSCSDEGNTKKVLNEGQNVKAKKAAEDHSKGRQRKKKLKEPFPASQEWSKTDITMAIMSQATYDDDDHAKPPCFEPNPVSNGAAISSGPVSDYKRTPASLKPTSCSDEGNTKKLLTEGQSDRAKNRRWRGLKIKDGNQYCDICKATLSSPAVADAHCKGKSHKKKLNKAFPTSHGTTETGLTTVSEIQANINVPTSFGLSTGCETVESSAPLPVCKETTAGLKLTPSSDKKILSSSGSSEATPSGAGAIRAKPTTSSAMKATPTTSSAMKATVAGPGSRHAIAAGSNQASGSHEEYIVNNNGTLECQLCKVQMKSQENAAQHLQGSSHKKKLEAFKAQDDSNEFPPELKPQGEMIIQDEIGAGKCFVCKTPINSKESVKQHIEGKKHINECKKYKLPVNMCI